MKKYICKDPCKVYIDSASYIYVHSHEIVEIDIRINSHYARYELKGKYEKYGQMLDENTLNNHFITYNEYIKYKLDKVLSTL